MNAVNIGVIIGVIPGRRIAASPEPMNTGLWKMASGFRPAGGPGMTKYGFGA